MKGRIGKDNNNKKKKEKKKKKKKKRKKKGGKGQHTKAQERTRQDEGLWRIRKDWERTGQ